jgi:hypothetical protein
MEKQIINEEEILSPEGEILIISTYNDGTQIITVKNSN